MTDEHATTFSTFLQAAPQGKSLLVSGAVDETGQFAPPKQIRSHCRHRHCDREMFFDLEQLEHSANELLDLLVLRAPFKVFRFLSYRCRNCKATTRTMALRVEVESGITVRVAKLGEYPQFSSPIGSKVIEIAAEDRELFLSGVRCESLGLGIGAFAYYRRVVENQRNRLFDAILKVVTLEPGSEELVKEIETAKREVQFKRAIDVIKHALPESLLLRGQNPLTLLHGALSQDLHEESDHVCLQAAAAIRVVLTQFVERVQAVLKDDKEISGAVKILIQKRDPAGSGRQVFKR